jgi:hypothetical protein
MVNVMQRLKDMTHKHDDKVDQGIDQAGNKLDERTGGKHGDQIDKGVGEAQRRTGPGNSMDAGRDPGTP